MLASPLLKVTNESPNPLCWDLAQVQWMKKRQQEQVTQGCDQSELRPCRQPPSRALRDVPAPGNKRHGWRSEPGSGFYIQEAFSITGQAEASASALLVVEDAVRTGLAATRSSFHLPKHLSQPPCPHSRGSPPAHRFLGWLFLRRPPFSSPPAVGWRTMPRRCTDEAVKAARAASRVLNQQQCPAPGRTPQLTCTPNLISFWGNSPWSGGQDAPSLQPLLSPLSSLPPEQLRETNNPHLTKSNPEKGDKNHDTELGRVCGVQQGVGAKHAAPTPHQQG